MARNRQVNWEKWVHGELVASLQAKGKLPKQHTTASDYKDKAYSNTAERIFPVTGEDSQDMTAVLMAEARQKLAIAQAKQNSQQLLQQQQQQPKHAEPPASDGRGSAERAVLKARIAAVQQQLKQQSSSCARLQQEIATAKGSEGAGGRARHAWSKAAPTVRQKLQLANVKLEERFTTAPGEAVHLAADAVAAGAAVVLAVGGDGTIHEVVNGMMAQSQQKDVGVAPATALGVLPLGTGSDFKRTFGWREDDVIASCERITGGKLQPIDVGRVLITRSSSSSRRSRHSQQDAAAQASAEQHQQQSTGVAEVKYFVNICSCGVGATTPPIVSKLKWLGTLSYPVASVAALLKYKPVAVQVSCDGGPWQTLEQLTMLVVGNGGYWGGGMRVFPRASTCDGLLDSLVVQRMGLLDFITKGQLLRSGECGGLRNVTTLPPCRTLSVRSPIQGSSSAAAVVEPWWELDGEGQGPCREVSIELLPSALQLCV